MPKIQYQTFKFRQATLAVIDEANKIIAEYQANGLKLTLRQLYYQFVSRGYIPNKQSEYNKLGGIINDGRLAGLIDWDALEDRTRELRSVGHWDSPQAIIDAVAGAYAIDKWADQRVRPEIWIEKDALAGVIAGVCRELDIGYFSCRGYTSQSEMWGAAMRFVRYNKQRQGVHVIHLGDHDPSGQDMSRDIEDRIRMFMSRHVALPKFEFTRIALNWDQIEQYNPPPNPAKSTDSRFRAYVDKYGEESWELDALDPLVIRDLIEAKIKEIRDQDLWDAAVRVQETERAQLTSVSNDWDAVVDFVAGRTE